MRGLEVMRGLRGPGRATAPSLGLLTNAGCSPRKPQERHRSARGAAVGVGHPPDGKARHGKPRAPSAAARCRADPPSTSGRDRGLATPSGHADHHAGARACARGTFKDRAPRMVLTRTATIRNNLLAAPRLVARAD